MRRSSGRVRVSHTAGTVGQFGTERRGSERIYWRSFFPLGLALVIGFTRARVRSPRHQGTRWKSTNAISSTVIRTKPQSKAISAAAFMSPDTFCSVLKTMSFVLVEYGSV
jgi:hypothetical protein